MTEKSIAQPFPHFPLSKQSFSIRRRVFGVGVNDAPYITHINHKGQPYRICPYYRVWRDMLKRSYYPKYHAKNPTYADCSVDPVWLSFMAFRDWMEGQDHEGMHLDKDLLVPTNKIYGPEFCVFVSRRVNNLITDSAANRGQWPIGVIRQKGHNRFQARCNNGNGLDNLGSFDTPEQAHDAYCARKSEVIAEVALEQPDPRVRVALLLRAENLLSGARG